MIDTSLDMDRKIDIINDLYATSKNKIVEMLSLLGLDTKIRKDVFIRQVCNKEINICDASWKMVKENVDAFWDDEECDWQEFNKNYPVITLCGSTRFKDEFMLVQKELTLAGNIVLSCGLFTHADDEDISEDQKIMLDDMHKRKIDMSGSIYVINVDGYIGESTKSEIAYATNKGKKVIYHINIDS